MRRESSELTTEQRAELQALEELPDDQIDTTDIPELLDWSNARRGLFYRPVKKQITLRIDADVIGWFRGRAKNGRGYQTDINRALRQYVESKEKRVVIAGSPIIERGVRNATEKVSRRLGRRQVSPIRNRLFRLAPRLRGYVVTTKNMPRRRPSITLKRIESRVPRMGTSSKRVSKAEVATIDFLQ